MHLMACQLTVLSWRKRGSFLESRICGEAQVGLGGWIRVGILILRPPTAPPSALSDAKTLSPVKQGLDSSQEWRRPDWDYSDISQEPIAASFWSVDISEVWRPRCIGTEFSMQVQGSTMVSLSLNSKFRVCCLSIVDSSRDPLAVFRLSREVFGHPRVNSDSK